MSVKIIERHFDPHLAAELVTLENSLGVRHVLTVHIADHEACPACGRPAKKKGGVPDVEQTIKDAIAEWEAHEAKLRAHLRRRPKK